MKQIKLPCILALGFLIAGLPLSASAADAPEKAAAPAAAETTAKAKPIPYQGTVGAVDKDKKSFTLKAKDGSERTFMVTDKTKILNKKQPATFDDIAADAYVTGSYLKDGDTLNAYSVHLGKTAHVKSSKKSKSATPAPAATETPEKK
jgi:hypothetical protein